jgi:hypothetical protein
LLAGWKAGFSAREIRYTLDAHRLLGRVTKPEVLQQSLRNFMGDSPIRTFSRGSLGVGHPDRHRKAGFARGPESDRK